MAADENVRILDDLNSAWQRLRFALQVAESAKVGTHSRLRHTLRAIDTELNTLRAEYARRVAAEAAPPLHHVVKFSRSEQINGHSVGIYRDVANGEEFKIVIGDPRG